MSNLDILKQFEGLRLIAYQDSAGIWTIGYGTIEYPDGTPVKKGDTCNVEQANEWLQFEVDEKTNSINSYIKSQINQNQFDALCSFAYNVGAGALRRSTLLKKVNANPSDPTIRDEFLKWNKAGGKVVQGLTNRRKAEANLYFLN